MRHMSEYKGWRIGITPRRDGDRWRADVEVWAPGEGTWTHGAMLLPFNDTVEFETAIIAPARSAAHSWIDSSTVPDRLALLHATLAFAVLPPTEPELRMAHRWLDTWRASATS
jgi:hypothetical protein